MRDWSFDRAKSKGPAARWPGGGARRSTRKQNGGNYQHSGSGADCGKTFGLALGAARRAAVSIALDYFGHLLYRHVDAERRCGLVDDADDDESADGWTCTGGWGRAGVSGDPAGRRACGHGGPSAFSAADTR